ncbi:Imm1 family immunity protein [Actinokineospora diospyrosa]|uniref:Immunity protein Imm1 n=1 Tax=Actinokineospora diospyrosa TaxID=103728 RepID=A0ABT1I956_9PSEU|nr:Imm1 family immunity protein [Actinokineospora diospyrosa]MCP2269150.1 Immunity protein Imm1 [Actinokineospora diospyrosa]
MYVNRISLDDQDAHGEREFGPEGIDEALVVELVKALDGVRHTLLSLSPGSEAHLAIGGGANGAYIVYMTVDNEDFYNLMAANPSPGRFVEITAGQFGEYPTATAVTLAEAVEAAVCYATSGTKSERLIWEHQA